MEADKFESTTESGDIVVIVDAIRPQLTQDMGESLLANAVQVENLEEI